MRPRSKRKIETVAEAAAAPVKAVADKAEVVAAPAIVNKPVIETKPVAKAKPKARRARKPATGSSRPSRKSTSAREGVKRARRTAAKKAAASVKQIEGTKTMTYDFNQLFAGFQLPGADKYQQFVTEANERSASSSLPSRRRPPRS